MPPPDQIVLFTQRLDLIPINRTHAERMFNVVRDPELYAFTNDSPPVDVDTLARIYELWENRASPDGSELWFNWALQLRGQDALIGHFQAGVTRDHADLAWLLGLQWHHHGYATEAGQVVMKWLVKLGLKKFHASINPKHSASIGVAERLGLRRTDDCRDSEFVWALNLADGG